MTRLEKGILLAALVAILQGIHLVFACRSNSECIRLNEMCKNNTCECRDDHTANSDGICVYKSTKKDRKSFYVVLVAVFSILIVIVLLSIIVFLFIWRRKANLLTAKRREDCSEMTDLRHKPSIRQILGQYDEPKYIQQEVVTATEEDFKRMVRSLRKDTQLFLKMVNEVKKKLNKLNDKNSDQGKQYKSLIRDLSRVLCILNTRLTNLEMPSDGIHLLLWAENAHKRFEYVELQRPINSEDALTLGECSPNINTKDTFL